MTTKLLLLCILAFAIIFVLRVRQKLAMLAAQIRGLREHALERVTYRPAGGAELGDSIDDATAEAEKLGFTMLGDFVEESRVTPQGRAMRWMTDAAGTTFGWIAPFDVDGQRHILIVLMSHELDAQTITSRQPLASTLTRPPFVTLQHLPPATSFAQVVAKHRDKAQLGDADRGHVPAKSFDQIVAELDRMRDKVIAWRSEQPADELLDSDLRSLLGPQYGKLAGPLKRRLA